MHVSAWDWDFEGGLGAFAGHAAGLARAILVDRSHGSTHTHLALAKIAPGGGVDRHVNSFEQCAYVLGGEPDVEIDGRRFRLSTGNFILFPVGVAHAWRNEGTDEIRLLEMSTPIPASAPAEPDTYFVRGSQVEREILDLANPSTRWVGRFAGTASQSEALAVNAPPRGRPPAGMDTALLAYSGISVKMMVDGGFGADLLTMFMVDYEPGGAAQVHDHPFEEAYVFLEGEIEGEIEGTVRTFRAGEVLFCGVGVDHAFFNTSGGHVRWIETQAPQPPRRHSYRWPAHWEHLRASP